MNIWDEKKREKQYIRQTLKYKEQTKGCWRGGTQGDELMRDEY